ncbi:MAG: AAA family ATPase [Paludibacteraceae bacterium]|nr:AAA family ATPase [Paludibacteraceae bacterium]
MYLKHVNISNFRCFKNFEVEFASGVTVLFGKNGAGKTTLINAIHKALSFIMYSDIIRKKEKGAKKSKIVEVKTITNGNPYLHVEGFAKDDYNNDKDPLIEIEVNAELTDEVNLSWSMSAFTNNAKIRTSTFTNAFNTFYNWHQNTKELPLLAYYSDGFPHAIDTKKKSIKKKIAALRNFGYFDWNANEACTKEWIERVETDLKEIYRIKQRLDKYSAETDPNRKPTDEVIAAEQSMLKQYEDEKSAIEDCFIRFSDSLENEEYKIVALDLTKDDKLVLKLQDKDKLFRELPAGFHRLFSIVLDIAIRSYILSQSVEARGIVIIDEIDLHLHPELERVVLSAFMKTFPNLQIVLSTHSYAVLAALKTEGKPNVILKMEAGQESPCVYHDIYGLDCNTVIEDVMGVESKNSDLDYMVSLCAYMKSKGEFDNYIEIKKDIIGKYQKNEDVLDQLVESKIKELANETH